MIFKVFEEMSFLNEWFLYFFLTYNDYNYYILISVKNFPNRIPQESFKYTSKLRKQLSLYTLGGIWTIIKNIWKYFCKNW